MTHHAQSMTDEEFAAWNEQMAKEYDPDLYHRSENRIVRWVEGRRVARLLSLLDVQPDHRVLEVGVGAGNILEKVQAKERAGIDLSEHLLTKAKARLGSQVHLMKGNAEALETIVQPRSFDRIYCSEVLEHVKNPDRVLQGMAYALHDEGVAVVSVPNESFINLLKGILKSLRIFKLLFPNMADHMEDEWHVHVFGRAMLRRLCSQEFEIERIVTVPFPFLPIRLVAKLHPKRS
jgi:2-polyprenyl-3-methyl-5-hydroxy-6-metoxy-1,4-benzoquinol methylase